MTALRKHPGIRLDVFDYIPPKVLHALRTASANLTRLNIPHAICGGVAVGAYGHVRATKDVDFLSGDEAFVFTPGGLAMMAPGVPFAIDGIPTDMVPLHNVATPNQDLSFLAHELEEPYDLDGMPVVSPEALILMKLVAFRSKDQEDVRAVLAAGATSQKRVRNYIDKYVVEGVRRASLLSRLERVLEVDE